MEKLATKVSFLEDKINLINQNSQFNITLMWTIFGVSIAIAGASLVILARSWIDKCVKNELKKINKEVEELKVSNNMLIKKINNMVKSEISDNSGFLYLDNGLQICYFKYQDSIKSSCVKTYMFPISFKPNTNVIPTVNVVNSSNIVANIFYVDSTKIQISFTNLNSSQEETDIEISVIAIGSSRNKL